MLLCDKRRTAVVLVVAGVAALRQHATDFLENAQHGKALDLSSLKGPSKK